MALSKDLGKVGLTSGFPNSEQDRLDRLKIFSGVPTGTALAGTIGIDVVNSDLYQYDSSLGSWELIGSSGSPITNTDQLPEGLSNLYFTTARARAAFNSSNSIAISSGSLSVKISSEAGNLLTLKTDGLYSGIGSFTSDQVLEGGTNLYFTTARARAAFSNGGGIDLTSGVISVKIDPNPLNLLTLTTGGLFVNINGFISNQNLADQTANFRINGIGRATKFSAFPNTTDPVGFENNFYFSNSQSSILRFLKARGSESSPSNVITNDNLGGIEFNGWSSSTGGFISGAAIRAISSNIWSTANSTANLQFFLRNASLFDKVMELGNDGSLWLPKIVSSDPNQHFLSVDNTGKVTVVNLSTAIGTGFILNQTASVQAANFRINGIGNMANLTLTNLTEIPTPGFVLSLQESTSTSVTKSPISGIISHFHKFQNMEDTENDDYTAFELYNGETATLEGTGLVQITMDSVTKKATIHVDSGQIAGVTSFKTRIGNVVPESGDYDFNMLSGGLSPLQDYTTGVTPGEYISVVVDEKGRVTNGLTPNLSLTGDVTGTGWPNIVTTIKNSGVVAGTYNQVTVNSKGIVTSATNVSPSVPNLQSVTTTGNIASNVLFLTGTSSMPSSGAGLLLTGISGDQALIAALDFSNPTNSLKLQITASRFSIDASETGQWGELGADNIGIVGNSSVLVSTLGSINFVTPSSGANVWFRDSSNVGVRVRGGNAVGTDEFITLGQGNSLYVVSSTIGAANGIAPLGSDSKIPSSYLPALAITETSVVNSQAAMLALTAQVGDVAVRTDINKSFILTADPASTLANWQELLSPGSPVLSVNGYTGAVTLAKSDIGLGNADNTSDINKPVSTAQQTALDLKENLSNKSTSTSLGSSDILYPTQNAVKTYIDNATSGLTRNLSQVTTVGNTTSYVLWSSGVSNYSAGNFIGVGMYVNSNEGYIDAVNPNTSTFYPLNLRGDLVITHSVTLINSATYDGSSALVVNGNGNFLGTVSGSDGTLATHFVTKNQLDSFTPAVPTFQEVTDIGATTDNAVTIIDHVIGDRILINGATDDTTSALQVNGNVAVTGTVTASGGFINSLRELKMDINLFTGNALDILDKVKINSFRYKNDEKNLTYGLIVDEAPNEFLSYDKKSVNQYSMIGILIKGIQELNKRIDDVMGRIGQ